MQLTEFLVTANADDSIALAEARAYQTIQGRLISPDMMLAFIAQNGYVSVLIDNPQTDLAKSVKSAMTFGSEFNLIIDHPQSILELAGGLVTEQTVSQGFIDALIAYANPVITPFANTSLHQVQYTRGTTPQLAVNQADGYVVINVTAQCELHNPILWATNPRTGKKQHIGNFRNVAEPGLYDCEVPVKNRAWALSVDNCYAVIEQA